MHATWSPVFVPMICHGGIGEGSPEFAARPCLTADQFKILDKCQHGSFGIFIRAVPRAPEVVITVSCTALRSPRPTRSNDSGHPEPLRLLAPRRPHVLETRRQPIERPRRRQLDQPLIDRRFCDGARQVRQSGERLRWAIIDGWLVVLRYGFPSRPANRLATYSLIALPIPTP